MDIKNVLMTNYHVTRMHQLEGFVLPITFGNHV